MLRRIAAVAAASVLVSGLATSPALAAGTATTITPDQAKTALQAAVAATQKVWGPGFTSVGSVTGSGFTLNDSAVMDGTHHIARDTYEGVASYFVKAKTGEWQPFADRYYKTPAATRKAWLSMLGKPSAAYVLLPNTGVTDADVRGYILNAVDDLGVFSLSPATTITSATETVNGTGTTYDVQGSLADGNSTTFEQVVDVTSGGVVSHETMTISSKNLNLPTAFSRTYTYGPQTVAAPAAASYVTAAQVTAAQKALASFTSLVKARANAVAAKAKAIATKAHRTKVTVADVRTAAKQVAAANATALVKVTTTTITGGVKLSAVNPLTHKTVAFTVKAVAGKAVVK